MAVKVNEHKLTALHAALVNGGVFVYVPKNVVLKNQFKLYLLHDNEDASLIQPRT